MRWLTVLLVVVLLGLATAKGGWKKKGKWQHKKSHPHHKSLMKKQSMDVNSVDDKTIGEPTEYGDDTHTKSYKLTHLYGKKVYKKKHGRKSKAAKKARKEKKMSKKMAWLNIRTDFDCELKCKPGQVCVSGPIVTKPICVYQKDLKKSVKTFHRFHKKEKKQWKKFQKQHYKSFDQMSYPKSEWKSMSKEEKIRMRKEEKYNKLGKKQALKEEELKPHHNKEFHHDKVKSRSKLHPKLDDTECGDSHMSQMKTRMMGWFHLLHGQDRQARKAHGGSIGKFYKHVSIKKELRDFNGDKCQCFKSALWQFHQMDKNKDDHLTEEETTYLKENSLEPCMKPYLLKCDRDGDAKISSNEWCCCFAHVLPPCYKQLSEIKKADENVSYLPRCDKEGYYMLEQCKGDKLDGSLTCWCVDQNGNEFEDTSVKGRAHCHKIEKFAYKQKVPLH